MVHPHLLMKHHLGYFSTLQDLLRSFENMLSFESKARLAVAREESGPGRNLPGNLPSRLACSFVPLFRLYLGPLPLGVEVGRQFHLPLPLISPHLMPGIRPEALVKRQISWNQRYRCKIVIAKRGICVCDGMCKCGVCHTFIS